MNELKPCPFCGKEARLTIFLYRPAITCTVCPAVMFGNFENKRDLIRAWNKRDSTEIMKHYWQGMADAEAKRKGELMQTFDPD